MAVNKERVELFVAALESDKYRQCTGKLRQSTFDMEHGLRYLHCALGVAVEVALLHDPMTFQAIGFELWDIPDLHEAVADWYGFDDTSVLLSEHSSGVDSISGWNDEGASFWEIAQAIRSQYLKD